MFGFFKPPIKSLTDLCTLLRFHFTKDINYFYRKNIEFWELNNIKDKNRLLKFIEHNKNNIKIIGDNFAYLTYDNDDLIQFVLFTSNSIEDVIDFIKNNNMFNNKSIFTYLLSELRKFKCGQDKNIQDILIKYPTSIVYNDYIALNLNLNVESYIIGSPPEVLPLPPKLKTVINNIKINKDCSNKIISVYLGNVKHPNVKNGYFCIGDLKGCNITLNNIELLLEYIKYFNINSCYYIPDEIKDGK